MRQADAVVVGAGFAGAGTARELIRRGVTPVVLERDGRPGDVWRRRYDGLRLNTIRWQSHMPGRRMPRSLGRWVKRDDVADYLEGYVRDEGLPVEFGAQVERIERDSDAWTVRTGGEDLRARTVVVASGYDREPKALDWPGVDGFTGELMHASEYRNAAPFEGKDVLVVSAGNTGSEIAMELLRGGASRVRTAIRSSPNIGPRELLGLPGPLFATGMTKLPRRVGNGVATALQRLRFGDLSEYGIPAPTHGLLTNVLDRGVAPVVDDGFIAAVKEGLIEVVPAVESFDGGQVVLADGERIGPDAVIAATGYRRALEDMVGHLGVLRADGTPEHNGVPGPEEAPGMWFVGYDTLIRGSLPLTRADAGRVARAVARRLRAK